MHKRNLYLAYLISNTANHRPSCSSYRTSIYSWMTCSCVISNVRQLKPELCVHSSQASYKEHPHLETLTSCTSCHYEQLRLCRLITMLIILMICPTEAKRPQCNVELILFNISYSMHCLYN
jgi:hypothetical protein